MSLVWLNTLNGADKLELEYAQRCLDEFDGHVYGAEMGIAYGGGVEAIGHLWRDRGTIYGFDTFQDKMPKHLADDPNGWDANCMDDWYLDVWYGTKGLEYDYQRGELDKQGLSNVVLIKGEVNKESCKDIPYLNYVFLDMDIPKSMANGYEAVKGRIVSGGYLLFHDYCNILPIRDLVDSVVASGEFEEVARIRQNLTAILKKV